MPNENELGSWRAVAPLVGAGWFAALEAPWWIAGGWALDLHAGEQTRPHEDLDVGILRRDFAAVRAALPSWEMFEAKDGVLTRLGPDDSPRSNVHSLWCRPEGTELWALEVMLDECDGDDWVYRREPSIRLPLTALTRRNRDGLPYLASEIQLLYKARWLRPRDQQDFERIAPHLDQSARGWLRDALVRAEPGHAWITALSG